MPAPRTNGTISPNLRREDASSSKAPSGTPYTPVSRNALVSTEEPLDTFYIDSGASDHLIPSRGDLHAYKKSAKPVDISAAECGKFYAYGPGTW